MQHSFSPTHYETIVDVVWDTYLDNSLKPDRNELRAYRERQQARARSLTIDMTSPVTRVKEAGTLPIPVTQDCLHCFPRTTVISSVSGMTTACLTVITKRQIK